MHMYQGPVADKQIEAQHLSYSKKVNLNVFIGYEFTHVLKGSYTRACKYGDGPRPQRNELNQYMWLR